MWIFSAWGSNLLGNRFSSTVANETHACASRCGLKHNLICVIPVDGRKAIFFPSSSTLRFCVKIPLGSPQEPWHIEAGDFFVRLSDSAGAEIREALEMTILCT